MRMLNKANGWVPNTSIMWWPPGFWMKAMPFSASHYSPVRKTSLLNSGRDYQSMAQQLTVTSVISHLPRLEPSTPYHYQVEVFFYRLWSTNTLWKWKVHEQGVHTSGVFTSDLMPSHPQPTLGTPDEWPVNNGLQRKNLELGLERALQDILAPAERLA